MDMERDESKVEFSWVKAHAGQRGNELADRLAKAATSSKDIEECYNRIPKSTVTSELEEQCLKQWQNEWETTTKGAATKSVFPNIEDILQLRNLIFVVPCIMLYSCEISPTRCNNCVFYS